MGLREFNQARKLVDGEPSVALFATSGVSEDNAAPIQRVWIVSEPPARQRWIGKCAVVANGDCFARRYVGEIQAVFMDKLSDLEQRRDGFVVDVDGLQRAFEWIDQDGFH